MFFMDSDDLITKTAFEELYAVAKNFQADVVQCEKFYQFPAEIKLKDIENFSLTPVSYPNIKFVDAPTLITDNLEERISDWLQRKFLWTNWTQLIRRDFIVESRLKFTNCFAQDRIMTCCLVLSAKKYVRVPNVINFYRIVENSASHKKRTPQDALNTHINTTVQGFQYINKFLSGHEFFQQHPDLKYAVLEHSILDLFYYLAEIYDKIPLSQLYDIACTEFEKAEDKSDLAALFFGRMNFFNVHLIKQQQIIQQLQAQLQALQK